MSEELKTGLTLDLNAQAVESSLEAITSDVNKMIQELSKVQKELGKMGPNAGQSMKEVSKTIGSLNNSLKILGENMSGAMGDQKGFATAKAELDAIISRLRDLESRMKTALSADVINDMMNAAQKMNDVFGRLNLGKLEVSLRSVDETMGKVANTLNDMVAKLTTAVELFSKLDLSKISSGSGVGYVKMTEDIAGQTEKLKEETHAWKDLQAARKAA